MPQPPHSRRTFVALGASALAALLSRPARAAGLAPVRPEHPAPRPGIDAARVVPATELPAHVTELFDRIRRIPHIVDGIRCACGCAELPEMYSLLSCYEQPGMAQFCMVCQGEGTLVARLHEEGRSLDEIRAAIDRRYG